MPLKVGITPVSDSFNDNIANALLIMPHGLFNVQQSTAYLLRLINVKLDPLMDYGAVHRGELAYRE